MSNCQPSGCQCACHTPAPGIEVVHLVACCPGQVYTYDKAYDEGGLPVHLPITVNAKGQGPCDDSDPDAFKTVCWCMDPDCMLFYPMGMH